MQVVILISYYIFSFHPVFKWDHYNLSNKSRQNTSQDTMLSTCLSYFFVIPLSADELPVIDCPSNKTLDIKIPTVIVTKSDGDRFGKSMGGKNKGEF